MDRKPIHELMLQDLNYKIAEADKNCSMHAATAATLRRIKDRFDDLIQFETRWREREATQASGEAK